MQLNEHEVQTILRLRTLETGFRDEFQQLFQSFLDEQERMLAMIECYESLEDGARYLTECEYDRAILHDFSLQTMN
jgi:hypothetical protein